IFTFIWEDSEEQAKLLTKKRDQFIKFKWLEDDDDDTYFEFRIEIDAITKDISLLITDFCDEDELEESRLLWESQVDQLHGLIGG
ncbi:MAG: SRPBCC domain-containing protein, partial [Flavobacteriales bacterium]|nr:SRPBCC domain-containing protein [Flavobacteriales bacterium]